MAKPAEEVSKNISVHIQLIKHKLREGLGATEGFCLRVDHEKFSERVTTVIRDSVAWSRCLWMRIVEEAFVFVFGALWFVYPSALVGRVFSNVETTLNFCRLFRLRVESVCNPDKRRLSSLLEKATTERNDSRGNSSTIRKISPIGWE